MQRIAITLALVLWGGMAWAGEILTQAPAAPDPDKHYLFYLHGLWLEDNGKDTVNKRYGRYEYDSILQAFADRGFTVIAELRPQRTRGKEYARGVLSQVGGLMRAGVPADHITVSGFSKGGQIALLVAALNDRPELRFVVMAGCGINQREGGFRQFLDKEAAKATGHLLALYDSNDQETGSCQEVFARAPALTGREEVLTIGRGHGVFYAADPAWLDKATAWAMGGE
ncbi:MAG: hypothetical protein A2516_02960 [Alphaproteobacteria bacterium RIFOXYD12_FULL_60_8]|nr:MAG: hypothetical protein A2516_02960 [Alphaproteobacteria bacterium RIFOXYD12_FULL_60_8]